MGVAAILRIQNDYSWLVTNNDSIKNLLWTSLRFRERNYFHNRAYKQKIWDGYTEFFKREPGKFLTGLLPEVRMALDRRDIPYEIVDERQPLDFRFNSVDDQFLNQWLPKTWTNGEPASPVTLHDYQVDLINQVIKNKRGVIYAPTASGKTYIMVGILKALPPGTPTLVLQNRISLAKQNYEEITNWGFPYCGMLGGGQNNPNIITCSTIQSIGKIKRLLPRIRCLIVDEIHDMMTVKTKAAYRMLKECCVRVALSATPFKFGETDRVQKYFVKGFFGPPLKTHATFDGKITTKELQVRQILAKSRCLFYPITEPQIPFDIYMDAVTHGIAESYHFHQVVSRLAKRLQGRTLILVERLAHGDALAGMIPGALWVQGKDDADTRQEVIRKLQRAKANVVAIATQGIFNTGINVFIHNLINAAGGQAEHQIEQRIGRGLRQADDKELLHYYDFVFKINEYLEKHSNKRVRILTERGHEVIIKESLDF